MLDFDRWLQDSDNESDVSVEKGKITRDMPLTSDDSWHEPRTSTPLTTAVAAEPHRQLPDQMWADVPCIEIKEAPPPLTIKPLRDRTNECGSGTEAPAKTPHALPPQRRTAPAGAARRSNSQGPSCRPRNLASARFRSKTPPPAGVSRAAAESASGAAPRAGPAPQPTTPKQRRPASARSSSVFPQSPEEPVWGKLYNAAMGLKVKKERMSEDAQRQKMAEEEQRAEACTFRPAITHAAQDAYRYGGGGDNVGHRLHTIELQKRERNREEKRKLLEAERMEACTFKPRTCGATRFTPPPTQPGDSAFERLHKDAQTRERRRLKQKRLAIQVEDLSIQASHMQADPRYAEKVLAEGRTRSHGKQPAPRLS